MVINGETRDAEFVGDFADGDFAGDQLLEEVDVDFVVGATRSTDVTAALTTRRRGIHVAGQRMMMLLLLLMRWQLLLLLVMMLLLLLVW